MPEYSYHPQSKTDLETGKSYDNDGNELAPGLTDSTKAEVAKLLAPRTATLVGNIADLQVQGADAAAEAADNGAKLPSGDTHTLVKTDPQLDPQVEPKEVVEADEAPVAKVELTTQKELDAEADKDADKQDDVEPPAPEGIKEN